jgi:hypothetical protein
MSIHVIPISDLMVHHESLNCPCNPQEVDGVIIHNAFDGRDFNEAIDTARRTS